MKSTSSTWPCPWSCATTSWSARSAYEKAEELVWRLKLKTIEKGNILFFFSRKPMCQMDYADYMEKDGIFGEKARIAWRQAGDEWLEYGDEPIPSPPPEDAVVHLNAEGNAR